MEKSGWCVILFLSMIGQTDNQMLYMINCPAVQRTSMIHEHDFIFCRIKFKTEEKKEPLEYFKFEVYREDVYKELICYIHLESCQLYRNSLCYCENITNQTNSKSLEVFLNFTAYLKFSKGRLMGTLKYPSYKHVTEWTLQEIIEYPFNNSNEIEKKCLCETDQECESSDWKADLCLALVIILVTLLCFENIALFIRHRMKKNRHEKYTSSTTSVGIQSEPEKVPKDDDPHQAPTQNRSSSCIPYHEYLAKTFRSTSFDEPVELVYGKQVKIK